MPLAAGEEEAEPLAEEPLDLLQPVGEVIIRFLPLSSSKNSKLPFVMREVSFSVVETSESSTLESLLSPHATNDAVVAASMNDDKHRARIFLCLLFLKLVVM